MKKLTVLCALFLLLLSSSIQCNADEPVTVWVDGSNTEFADQKPFILNSRTMLPISPIAKKMGKNTDWDEKLSLVTISDSNTTLKLTPESAVMLVNNIPTMLDTAPVIENGRLCLPVRAVAEAFGAEVYWDGSAEEVHIVTKEFFERTPLKVMGDEFRITENEFYDCGNCYCINGEYFFSPVSIQPHNAIRYAEIINKIAEAIPDANVYNMLVPDSYEIYAPKRFYTGQWQAFEYIYSNLSSKITPIRVTEKLLEHGNENIYFNSDHHWTHKGAYYAWESFCEEKGFIPPDLSNMERADTDKFAGSYMTRMESDKKQECFIKAETMERYIPDFETELTVYSDSEMKKKIGKPSLINTKNNTYSCFISGDHPLTVIKSSIGNGKKLAIIKESFGNALATWAVNNYEYVYVIDIRGFKGGLFKISDFYELTKFDDLIIESYPTTVESSDLRGYISEMIH